MPTLNKEQDYAIKRNDWIFRVFKVNYCVYLRRYLLRNPYKKHEKNGIISVEHFDSKLGRNHDLTAFSIWAIDGMTCLLGYDARNKRPPQKAIVGQMNWDHIVLIVSGNGAYLERKNWD